MSDKIKHCIAILSDSASNNSLVKGSLTNYRGEDATLKKVLFKPVSLKDVPHIQLVYRHASKDVTKNITPDHFILFIQEHLGHSFHGAFFATSDAEYTLQRLANNKYTFKKKSANREVKTDHNRKKKYLISSDAAFLYHLGITTKDGKVHAKKQSKYRQINRYVELVSPHILSLKNKAIHVTDMGSGKGYLTFALYDHLVQNKINITMDGVELRKELVDTCNTIAASCDYTHLKFEEKTIQDYEKKMDICMALHACNTATDDAIIKGLVSDSDLIIVAPCCHKQVRRSMTAEPLPENAILLDSGIHKERLASILTDVIRAQFLEAHGYEVQTMEFIDTAHTPKNVLLLAKKKSSPDLNKMDSIRRIMKQWGITSHYLIDNYSM